MKTPVVLLIFNRPDTTEKVFEAVRQAKPPKLLVVADGARSDRPDEAEKCAAARTIIDRVDWDCEVLTDYSNLNLGCKLRVSTGLDWVFSQVEEAIILEDDCVPDPSFFRFCEELLDYYRSDRRIMAISGDNFQFGRRRTKYSYYYSRYNHCWGWATWGRAWEHYDIKMSLWQEIKEGNWLEYILGDTKAVNYWRKIFQLTYDEQINSWAYRWTFACWLQNGLTVLPEVNLVSNIGYATEGTHTVNKKDSMANLPRGEISFPLQHPPYIIRHAEADNFTQSKIFGKTFLVRAVNKAKKLFTLNL
ncbi:hemolytic protein HlpA [Myxosarcina sp. GI1]|uniref:hemolytic protein HlpA n=1 Tax=Myxosarcina sp. GI1 TaxID=1541065 RepID=UPI000560CF29|nr:hemolytic protein HlpA [Myxosarcina sp. GI1]